MSYDQFCKTDLQKQIMKLNIEQGISPYKIAKLLNIDNSNVRRIVTKVKERAQKAGYSPEHDWTHPVPDGHKIKGVSTYYNEEGKAVGQWVKSQTDHQRQFEILCERLEESHKNVKRFKPTKSPASTQESLLSLLTITDFHLGMYAWEAESGEDWNVQIARQTFLNSIHDMVKASPKSGTAVLCQLGDFLHWDGILSITPSSGHILDADTRYGKLVDLAMYVMVEAISIMLKHFGKVVVVSAEGNHDISGSIWLRKHISHVFNDEPRVEVIDNEFPYYAYLHGETMIAFHHGHKMKLSELHKLFASEPRFRGMWGEASYTYIHTGHYHSEKVIENGGAIAEQHPTLSARDAYAARGGWVSRRGAKVITYDKVHGEVARVTVRPRA